MDKNHLKAIRGIECQQGELPEALGLSQRCNNKDELRLSLTNHSNINMSQIEITLSYYDDANLYLDYQDFLAEPLAAGETRVDFYNLKPAKAAHSCTVDITASQQTFVRRHWKLISTVGLVIWTLILLSRRWSDIGP